MLIFIEPRIVLHSIPKTGTTALEAVLSEQAEISFRSRPEIKHLNHRQYLNRIKPLLTPIGGAPFESVAVIREPLDWLRSWYRFRTRAEIIGRPNSTVMVSFDRFLHEYLSSGRRQPYAQVGRQSNFLLDNDGKPAVDYVFRYEAMPALVAFLSARLKMPIELPRSNVSPDAVTELSPEVEAMAREALAEEYAIWESALQAAP
ncbi:gamma-glutamyl kinase [Paracoccus aestuariivivens]|uniref:Gamma-glutamyl kinase n=1 Tax=Paracoccus aestuariivivens TaxID=1820333 RepID=A0A6L6JC61_9RHOB|nr:gamma-glutamyl kinase [Paracoccus aestuariivivens]MTH78728.1 gamma-glutamyl kinase [Paracoccus aestuariivivens]